MNTQYLSNTILIDLLKQFGIKKLVLSSGTRNIPFVSQVETDTFFECYSVVDERNAAFFALGLSLQSGEPVGIACTSGTATSNYLSGITEAYYTHAPIVAISFDRSMYVLNQLETQKVNQPAIFECVTQKSVCLPPMKDEDDIWYCKRVINEALIALRQHGGGPVHINVPLCGDTNALNQKASSLDKRIRKINYYSAADLIDEEGAKEWERVAMNLSNCKRVMVVMGQNVTMSQTQSDAIKSFCKKMNSPLLADNLSNFRCDEFVMSEAVIKALNAKAFEDYLPEIIITFGNNFQERIKDLFKANAGKFEHWSVDESGTVRDVFRSETRLFECSPKTFFSYFEQHIEQHNDHSFIDKWRAAEAAATLPELPYGSFYVVKEFANRLPKDSILHLSILNSTRLMQFFKLDESIKVYSNVNTFGIDGCLPTFMGQAAITDGLAFMMTGDLSFFYAMNALGIKHVKNNVRVLILNNHGAAEFHIQPDSHNRPTVDLHIGCEHSRTAKGWATSLGYKYLTASDESSLENALNEFVIPNSDTPVLLEVFTDMHTDGPLLLSVYRHLEKQVQNATKTE